MTELANIFALFAPQAATKAGGAPSAPVPSAGATATSAFAVQLAAQGSPGVAAPAGMVAGQGLANTANGLQVTPILADADRIDGTAGPVDTVGQFDLATYVNAGQTTDIVIQNTNVAPEEIVGRAGITPNLAGPEVAAKSADSQVPNLAARPDIAERPDAPGIKPSEPLAPGARPSGPQLAVGNPVSTVVAALESTGADGPPDPLVLAAIAKAAKPDASPTTPSTQAPRAGTAQQQSPAGADFRPNVRPEADIQNADRLAVDRQLRPDPASGAQTLARTVKTAETPEQITIATTVVDRPRDLPRDFVRARLVPSAAGAPHAPGPNSAGAANQVIQAPVLTALLASASGPTPQQPVQPSSAQPSSPQGMPFFGGEAFGTDSLQPQTTSTAPIAISGADTVSGQQRASVEAAAKPISRLATEHVAVNIAGAVRGGLRQITIQMRPASLGEIDVDIKISNDGHVSAQVRAERPETLEMLQRDARGLERALQDAGLKTDSGGLSFGLRGDGRGGATADRQHPTMPQYALPAEEPEVDLAGAYASSLAASGRVDIRV